tara:strand:+ start:190 stop:408 length:219 start_codon:yes stop_codon:yes gene_type:complete
VFITSRYSGWWQWAGEFGLGFGKDKTGENKWHRIEEAITGSVLEKRGTVDSVGQGAESRVGEWSVEIARGKG